MKAITVYTKDGPKTIPQKYDDMAIIEKLCAIQPKDSFGLSLCDPKNHPLSRKQLNWAHVIVHEHEEYKKKKELMFPSIIEMFGAAINHGAKRIVVRSENLKFSVNWRDRFGNPQQRISIKNHKTGVWYAYLNMDGKLDRNVPLEVIEELTSIEEDPFEYARRYGHLTGNCMFCGLQLTHKASIHFGYGPICAEKFGRPHSYGVTT